MMQVEKKKVGIVKSTALVASNMIGSGALLAPMVLAPYGSWALIGWVITTFGALALAFCFSRLSEWFPGAGGPYMYVQRIFGNFAGFQVSWFYWFSTWCGSASLVIGTLQYLSIFWPDILASDCVSISIGLIMIWGFTTINMFGISESMSISFIVLLFKTLPLILFALFGVFKFDISVICDKFDVQFGEHLALMSMMQPLLWAFIGLESATVPSEHIDNPKKVIPIATISGVLITACVYILGALVINGVLTSEQLAVSKAPYVDAGYVVFGDFGKFFMMLTGIIGLIGSLNGWILIHGQVSYSAAQHGLFPKLFSRVNKRNAPIGVLIGSICMSILFVCSYSGALSRQIGLLIDLSVLAMVIPYFYCVSAVITVCYKKLTKCCLSTGDFCLLAVAILALVYAFFAIFSAGNQLMILAFFSMLVAAPLYCFVKNEK